MLCIPITGPDLDDAKRQIVQASELADLLELRLDCFHTRHPAQVEMLVKLTKLPILFTLRKHSQGGFFSGPEKKRLEEIKELACLNPGYIDLEYDTSRHFIDV